MKRHTKENLINMFPTYTKETLRAEIDQIKNAAHLTIDEKISQLETLKTMVTIGANPPVQLRRIKKFMKSIN